MNNTKKVLIVSQEAPPMVGGAGIVGWQNAKQLSEQGSKVTFLTVSNEPLNSEGFDVVVTPRKRKLWVFSFAKKLKELLIQPFDIIIINDIGSALVFSLIVKDQCILDDTIVYLHGGEVLSIFKKPSTLFKVLGFKNRYVRLLQRCKSVVAVSHYMKEYFLKDSAIDLASERITVVYAGIDSSIFHPVNYNANKEHNIAEGKTLLLSVGRITREKGFAVKFDIYKKLIAKNADFHWIIVGDGEYLAQLKRGAADHDLEKYITFTGALPREKLPGLYSCADVFWLLSLREAEAFGLVYVEAQVCGTPAIGFNKFGVVEAIADKKSGFLVGDADECLDVLSGQLFKNISRDSTIEFSSRFYLKEQIKNLLALV